MKSKVSSSYNSAHDAQRNRWRQMNAVTQRTGTIGGVLSVVLAGFGSIWRGMSRGNVYKPLVPALTTYLLLASFSAFPQEPGAGHARTVRSFIAAFNAHDGSAMSQFVADAASRRDSTQALEHNIDQFDSTSRPWSVVRQLGSVNDVLNVLQRASCA